LKVILKVAEDQNQRILENELLIRITFFQV